jgi:arylsulfatase A-like enzyme/Flp pilus assembly protein TadD
MFDKRLWIAILLLIVSFESASGSAGELLSGIEDRGSLNLLLITVDTLRADKLSCYGSKTIQTPYIDALAKRGNIFTRAFAHNPLTLPSHANILLGTTPLYHGVHDNMNFIIREEFLTLAEHLKNHGYATGAVLGAFPLDSRFGIDQGFDFYEDEFKRKGLPKYAVGERRAEVVVQIAQKWLDGQLSPWFLWMHIWDPHFPYESPEPFLSQYGKKPYNGEVAYVDDVLGKFFQHMAEKDLMAKTLILFTSDHGESLGDHGEKTHGMLAYNSTIWIPLIIVEPRMKPRKIRGQVSHIDIFPTVCDLIGIPKPDFLQGISLLPLMQGKKNPDRAIYFESLEPYYNFGWAPLRGFIRDKDKFIDTPIPELYNLELDFNEKNNLAENLNAGKFRSELKDVIEDLSHPDSTDSQKKYDFKTLQKLRSLGYVGYSSGRNKKKFERKDDIKVLLPLLNKCLEAYGYGDEGDIDRGIELLQKMVKEKVRIYQPYVYLAKLLHDVERVDEAILILESGLERYPENYEILRYYAQYLAESAQYEMVIDLIKTNNKFQMEQDPVIWNILGRSYFEKGQFGEAIEALEKALSIDKEFADAFSNLGYSYLSLAAQTEEETSFFKAVENLKKALALDPRHEKASYALGLAFLQIGDYQEAIYRFEASLRLGLKNGKIFFNLGVAYLSQNNLEKACSYFNSYKDEYLPTLSDEEKRNLEQYLRRCKSLKKLWDDSTP